MPAAASRNQDRLPVASDHRAGSQRDDGDTDEIEEESR